ncbi:MAG: ORF6N domain-containing protein [Thermoleophilia bacterium]
MEGKTIIPVERIEASIFYVRGQRVMLDVALAKLYQVETRVLLQAVKRNIERFPEDFMFEMTREEAQASRSQSATLKRGEHLKYLPHAFTEQGVAMLSSVLRSKRAIQVNIEIMRAFVQMKKMLSSYEDLTRKLDALEKKYDVQFSAVFDAIRQLMEPPKPKKKQVGFHWVEESGESASSGKKALVKKRPPTRKRAPTKSK